MLIFKENNPENPESANHCGVAEVMILTENSDDLHLDTADLLTAQIRL